MSENPRQRIVVVGGGFGGLLVVRGLGRVDAAVTLVDRRNHHLFQPLLYQVATGGLSPANIAAPLRSLVKHQQNTRVLLAEVAGFDLDDRQVQLRDGSNLPCDQLVVATGAGQSYFGQDEWETQAPGLKSLEDATRIRRRVLPEQTHIQPLEHSPSSIPHPELGEDARDMVLRRPFGQR